MFEDEFDDILVESDESLRKPNLPNLTTGKNYDGEFGPVPPKGTEIKASIWNDSIGELNRSFKEACYILDVLSNTVPVPDQKFEEKYGADNHSEDYLGESEEDIDEEVDEIEEEDEDMAESYEDEMNDFI